MPVQAEVIVTTAPERDGRNLVVRARITKRQSIRLSRTWTHVYELDDIYTVILHPFREKPPQIGNVIKVNLDPALLELHECNY